MSSLAAAQADGYYVPVEYYESGAYKKQSKNQWAEATTQQRQQKQRGGGQKRAAGEAAAAVGPVVRFELPYDGVCESCGAYIKRGTRFNASKTKVGDYYSTPIYEFRMSCRACPSPPAQEFAIRVDPAAFGFDYLEGIRKHCREFEAEPDDRCVPAARAGDAPPLTEVERMEIQQEYLQRRSEPDLTQLRAVLDHRSKHFHDAAGNARLRTEFRSDRKKRKRQLRSGEAVGWRKGLALLEGSTLEETVASKSAVFGDCVSDERRRWKAVRGESIFHRLKGSSRKRGRGSVARPDEAPSSSGAPDKKLGRRRRRPTDSDIAVVDLTEEKVEISEANDPRTPSTGASEAATAKKRRVLTVVPPSAKSSLSSVVSRENPPAPSSTRQPPGSSLSALLASYSSPSPSPSDGDD
jgi:hypothetical protein